MAGGKPTELPCDSHYTRVLGARMHYIEHGAGDPIVLSRAQVRPGRSQDPVPVPAESVHRW